MQPMGRKPTRFPGKEDCHPTKGSVNWWEWEIDTSNKKGERAAAKREIRNEIAQIDAARAGGAHET